jgi:hypothetical protein
MNATQKATKVEAGKCLSTVDELNTSKDYLQYQIEKYHK